MEELIGKIEKFQPWNEQEEKDKTEILALLRRTENIFSRENRQYHMTASAWVVNQDRSRVLMVYHNIYKSWSWLGGHADGERDLLKTALREVREESGLSHVSSVRDDIFSLEILTVDGHRKKGEYVPSHLHLNITYLLEADDREMLTGKADENAGAAWFSPAEAVAASSEPWFREHIYPKLNEKLKTFA